jgi:predicted transcriptional regulator
MSVDRLSVTVPGGVGAALRALADARGTTVSTIVAQAISHEIRLAALERALAAANNRFGAVDEKLVAQAQSELSGKTKGSKPRRPKR